MTPESLVPTRETSLRLKEKGFPQDTYFCWGLADDADADSDDADEYQIFWDEGRCPNLVWESSMIAAPTLAEVLEQLPDCKLILRESNGRKAAGYLTILKIDGFDYSFSYVDTYGIQLLAVDHQANPVEAAALLWEKAQP